MVENNIAVNFVYDQILRVISAVDHEVYNQDGVYIFVPRDNVAIEVSQSSVIPDDLSYDVLAYNHYSYKGNIPDKKSILLRFANILEAKRNDLKNIDKDL